MLGPRTATSAEVLVISVGTALQEPRTPGTSSLRTFKLILQFRSMDLDLYVVKSKDL